MLVMEAHPRVAHANILEVILLGRAYICPTPDVVPLRLRHEVCVLEIPDVGGDGGVLTEV